MNTKIIPLGICMLTLALTVPTVLANATNINIAGPVGEASALSIVPGYLDVTNICVNAGVNPGAGAYVCVTRN